MAPSFFNFCVSSAWMTLSVQLMIAVAAGEQGGGELCSPVLCGNINISFPFGLIPEPAMETSCGATGFQVRCANNSTPYLGYFRREHWFQILNIFYDTASLLVADVYKLNVEGLCHGPTNNTPAHLGLPFFSISPANHVLIFYNCTAAPAPAVAAAKGLVETRCGNSTFARIGGRYDDESTSSYGRYFLEGCDAAVVPVLGRSGWTDASRYEELIGEGFLLTWQLPPSADELSSSSHESTGMVRVPRTTHRPGDALYGSRRFSGRFWGFARASAVRSTGGDLVRAKSPATPYSPFILGFFDTSTAMDSGQKNLGKAATATLGVKLRQNGNVKATSAASASSVGHGSTSAAGPLSVDHRSGSAAGLFPVRCGSGPAAPLSPNLGSNSAPSHAANSSPIGSFTRHDIGTFTRTVGFPFV